MKNFALEHRHWKTIEDVIPVAGNKVAALSSENNVSSSVILPVTDQYALHLLLVNDSSAVAAFKTVVSKSLKEHGAFSIY